jgi:hypothetical protein
MDTFFHTILIEPAPERARLLTSMLGGLGAIVTHATDATRASRLLSLLLPDLLVIGCHPATASVLAPWLSSLLTATPLRTLLYAEKAVLLGVMMLELPLRASTMPWPCSQHELAYLAAPLLARAEPARRTALPVLPDLALCERTVGSPALEERNVA